MADVDQDVLEMARGLFDSRGLYLDLMVYNCLYDFNFLKSLQAPFVVLATAHCS